MPGGGVQAEGKRHMFQQLLEILFFVHLNTIFREMVNGDLFCLLEVVRSQASHQFTERHSKTSDQVMLVSECHAGQTLESPAAAAVAS